MEDGDGLAQALGSRRPRRSVLVAVVLPWLVVGVVLLRDVPARFATRAPAPTTDPVTTARPSAPPALATARPTTGASSPERDPGRRAGGVDDLDVAGVLLAARRAVERGVLAGAPGTTARLWPLDLVVVGIEGPGTRRTALVAGTALRGGPDGWGDLTRVHARVPVDADGLVAGPATSADSDATPVDPAATPVDPAATPVDPAATPVDPADQPGRPGPTPTSTPTERAR